LKSTTNPDRARQRLLSLWSSIGTIRAQRLTVTQGREDAAVCAHCGHHESRVAKIEVKQKAAIRREGIIVGWAVTKVFERWELQCAKCKLPWQRNDAETPKGRRRRKEPTRFVDPSDAHTELLDLTRVFRRPPGFSNELWWMHLDLWDGLLDGLSYDGLAEKYGSDLAALGIGQGEEASGRTVARMVRVARDLVESALIEQQQANEATALRYALA
jgi:hypothetical protein